jgi:hypothetical protein
MRLQNGGTLMRPLHAAKAMSLSLEPKLGDIEPELLAKHCNRKHGPGAYYGQK